MCDSIIYYMMVLMQNITLKVILLNRICMCEVNRVIVSLGSGGGSGGSLSIIAVVVVLEASSIIDVVGGPMTNDVCPNCASAGRQ